jgi:hypothetical protein
MLKPLAFLNTNEKPIPDDLLRTCECCSAEVPGSQAINFMACIGVAGDPRINPFQCPHEEHWACSLECWAKVANACIEEHIGKVLAYHHNVLGTVHAEKKREK